MAQALKRSRTDFGYRQLFDLLKKSEHVDAFKQWFKELAKHCQRHGYGQAGLLFEWLCTFERLLITPEKIGELMDKATEVPSARLRFRDVWDFAQHSCFPAVHAVGHGQSPLSALAHECQHHRHRRHTTRFIPRPPDAGKPQIADALPSDVLEDQQ